MNCNILGEHVHRIKFVKMKSELEKLDDQQLRFIKREVERLLNEMDQSGELLSDEEIEFISRLYRDVGYD